MSVDIINYMIIAAQVEIRKSELPGIGSLPDRLTSNSVPRALAIVFGIAGGISLIIVAYGGLKFVLSQGNPQEVTKAKNTIIDGLIGLAVIATAGSIVGFVITALT